MQQRGAPWRITNPHCRCKVQWTFSHPAGGLSWFSFWEIKSVNIKCCFPIRWQCPRISYTIKWEKKTKLAAALCNWTSTNSSDGWGRYTGRPLFLTRSRAGDCAPREWSCRGGTEVWRLTGRCWGHWDGATGRRWVAPSAESELHPPAEAQTWGCIWCLLLWSSTARRGWEFLAQWQSILVDQHYYCGISWSRRRKILFQWNQKTKQQVIL